ncbi:replicative DNA helicase [uncultured Jatrophihabitans sp.]|uniref:replicative DNA helicase n=1 Tax=uncultured Jatrophihabitans sp. TaxID=1610747 RepID=UPI0035CAEBDE
MTLIDEGSAAPRPAPSAGRDFDRTPPQAVEAEQSVLGAMMLSKDAIADVVEVIKPGDFYRPAHQLVYDAVLDLYARGEPADAVTVSAELTRAGQLARIGGAPYLHTLISGVPTAANAGYYAAIVADRATLRRLVIAGTRIVQWGYDASSGSNDVLGSVDDVVDRAQAEVYEVTERRTSEDYVHIGTLLEGTLDEIERISASGGVGLGVPTGFQQLDEITNGLHPGQMITVAGRPGSGKALALDTPLPTPTGWTTMGEVQVGELLLGADGRPTQVVAATDVLNGRPCFELEFSDGTVITADAEHQWLTTTRASRRRPPPSPALWHTPVYSRRESSVAVAERVAAPVGPGASPAPAVVTTVEIARTLRCPTADGRPNHAVACAAPLELPDADLLVPPYTLGAWLSDATSAAEDKHIPAEYLRASAAQRRALLAGLLDTDGHATRSGCVEFGVPNRRLAEDVFELVVSLGYRAAMRAKRVAGRSAATSTTWTVTFTPADRVFGLDRKAERQVDLLRAETRSRHIVDARPVPSVPVRCVQVDNADHMYLASRAMVPTHNSTLALDFARSAAVKHQKPTAIFSLEMGKLEIMMRLFSAEAGVALQNMRSGHMNDQDWTRLARRSSELAEAPLFIDDSPNLTMMEIRAKARRLRQRHDLQLIVIDYLQLMTSGKRVESRQQEVSEFSRSMKLLAKELDVPVVALSQLNRGPEQRTDKKPLLSDLRESGCLPAATRVWRADTGAEEAIGDLYARGERNIVVWALDGRLRMVPRIMTHVFPTGVKPVYRLRLASGRTVDATANHPFYTYDGWRDLGDLAVGNRVAIARQAPEARDAVAWPDHEIVLLAHLLGAGSDVSNHPSTDAAWLDGLGLFGLRSHEKFIPAGVFGLPDHQLRSFLRQLWAADGGVDVSAAEVVRVYYASTSRRLADDVARLLTRVGVTARITTTKKAGCRDSYHVHVVGSDQQTIFLRDVGVHGARGAIVERALPIVSGRADTNLDTVPHGVWERVRAVLHGQRVTHPEFAATTSTQSGGGTLAQHSPGRARLARVADVLDDAELDMLATNDVFWDEVVGIDPLGEQPVFDATVPGEHNFLADGVMVHNSIEQDSDLVLLVHRPDLYEPETERAGEADLIIAKHRNGPTATVAVAFQGRYSRFADMPS